ncbi:MAG: tRNA lysidine(34) synthetase TilS, partial [Panacibacter sp.]
LLNNIDRFKETEVLYKQVVEQHKKKLVERKGDEWQIPVLKLQKTIPLNTILWEIIKDFDFTAAQVPEIKKLFDANNGSYMNSGTHRIIKNRNWLIITSLHTETAHHILIEANDRKITFENGLLQLNTIPHSKLPIPDTPGSALLDGASIKFPLLLRKWKQGDYFYPLGMNKKKKLSKFFIDQKLSKTEKEKVWVLESDQKIIWVVGYRIDNRFKITDGTTSMMHIECKNKEKL